MPIAKEIISRPWQDLFCFFFVPGTCCAACRAIFIRSFGALIFANVEGLIMFEEECGMTEHMRIATQHSALSIQH